MGEDTNVDRLAPEEADFLDDVLKRDLDRRLDELEQDGPTGLSWEEAVTQIRSGKTWLNGR